MRDSISDSMRLAVVLLTFSAANALLPQLSSLAPTRVSPRVTAARLVAADPSPLQQKPGAAVGLAARNPDGLLQSRRPLSRKQLKEPAFQWLNKELQWVAQDFLLMVEEESMGFLTVQEERDLLQVSRERFEVGALQMLLQARRAKSRSRRSKAAEASVALAIAHPPTVWAAFSRAVQARLRLAALTMATPTVAALTIATTAMAALTILSYRGST